MEKRREMEEKRKKKEEEKRQGRRKRRGEKRGARNAPNEPSESLLWYFGARGQETLQMSTLRAFWGRLAPKARK